MARCNVYYVITYKNEEMYRIDNHQLLQALTGSEVNNCSPLFLTPSYPKSHQDCWGYLPPLICPPQSPPPSSTRLHYLPPLPLTLLNTLMAVATGSWVIKAHQGMWAVKVKVVWSNRRATKRRRIHSPTQVLRVRIGAQSHERRWPSSCHTYVHVHRHYLGNAW